MARESAFRSVLEQKFARGFRLLSSIEIRRFRDFFSQINQYELLDSDEEIIKTITKLGLEYHGKILCINTLINQELLAEIKHFIRDSFRKKKNVIYYSAIISRFQNRMLETNIANEEMLRAILEAVNNNEYIINSSYLTSVDHSMEPQDLIRTLMIEQGVPMTVEEIQEKLPQFTVDVITYFAYYNSDIFSVGSYRFLHVNCIQITTQELNFIVQLVERLLKEQNFITGTELVKHIHRLYPYIIENNAILSDSDLRYAFMVLLKKKFSVNGNIISTLGVSHDRQRIFSQYVESQDEITLNELDDLRKSLSSATIPMDVIYRRKIRLNEDLFVGPDNIFDNIDQIDCVIEQFCPDKYIPLCGIGKNGYLLFPGVRYPWTDYLLESYVYLISKKFQLLHGSFNTSCCVGAIVRRTAGIQTFDKLLVDVLAHSEEELTASSALDFFYREGYIARRRFNRIEQIIAQARVLRFKIKNNS